MLLASVAFIAYINTFSHCTYNTRKFVKCRARTYASTSIMHPIDVNAEAASVVTLGEKNRLSAERWKNLSEDEKER